MPQRFANSSEGACPLYLVEEADFESWSGQLSDAERAWMKSQGFSGKLGQAVTLPGADGRASKAVAGYGKPSGRSRGRFHLARAAARLPDGTYELHDTLDAATRATEALGWLLGQYRFDRYKEQGAAGALLVAPDGVDAAQVEAIAAGETLSRDLINTPASDMGPDALQKAAEDLAGEFGAKINVIVGEDLLAQNFPMIHTVGRAADRAPRLIDITWGSTGPTLTLVGKGVCFDTGGLNLKPGASMGLMKKDMGGAATVLGLARMIMASNLPLQLRVLVPAVENAVSGNAFRPQDILTSRKGLTVEINNTDAEGRLVLADALALADETPPDLMISMATLTGAARVAVGPDIAPFYCDDTNLALALSEAGESVADPVWRMPFHDPYESMIEPGIADLDNAPKGGFAGSITAALFLRRFVTDTERYMHFDIYGWQPSSAPGRPKGGVGQGARAVLEMLPEVLGL